MVKPNPPKNRRNFFFNISEEFKQNIKKLQGQVRIDAERQAIHAAGKILKKSARDKAAIYDGKLNTGHYKYPNKKGKTRKPGTLKRSIVFKLDRDKSKSSALFSVKNPVGHLVEYGHRTRKGLVKSGLLKGTKRQGQGRGLDRTRAFPFMRPAIMEKSSEANKKMAEVLEKFLRNL